jgi:hypothetical protein
VTEAISPEIEAGQAIYTRRTLALYDLVVLGASCRFVWKCPSRRMLGLYDRHVTANHLDVGVGTGYFLDRCRFPSPAPRNALLDLNAAALAYTAGRIARYRSKYTVTASTNTSRSRRSDRRGQRGL